MLEIVQKKDTNNLFSLLRFGNNLGKKDLKLIIVEATIKEEKRFLI